MAMITKSPPWETFYNEVMALFGSDPGIKIVKQYAGEEKKIKFYVSDPDKLAVMKKYLPEKKVFGTTSVALIVVDQNDKLTKSSDEMKTLFKGNPAVSVIDTRSLGGGDLTYVAFKNGVVQFFDDNLADLNRNKTMLMENIARDLFDPIDGVYFCTDVPSRNRVKHATTSIDSIPKFSKELNKLMEELSFC